MGKRELVALLNLSSWYLAMVEQLFLAVPGGCLRFVIVVFPDHTHLLFLMLQTHKQHCTSEQNKMMNICWNKTCNWEFSDGIHEYGL